MTAPRCDNCAHYIRPTARAERAMDHGPCKPCLRAWRRTGELTRWKEKPR